MLQIGKKQKTSQEAEFTRSNQRSINNISDLQKTKEPQNRKHTIERLEVHKNK